MVLFSSLMLAMGDGCFHFTYSFVLLFWFLCGSQHDDIISFRRNILIPLSIITYTFKYLYFFSEKHYALLRIS